MSKARNGKVIRPARLTARELARLSTLLREARALRDVATWRRAKAVLGYAQGRSAITMATELRVDRSAVTKWVGWYAAHGTDALRTRQIPGRAPRLSEQQRAEVIRVLAAGPPQAIGVPSRRWTGALVSAWIEQRFGVHFHPQHVPRMLRRLGLATLSRSAER